MILLSDDCLTMTQTGTDEPMIKNSHYPAFYAPHSCIIIQYMYLLMNIHMVSYMQFKKTLYKRYPMYEIR